MSQAALNRHMQSLRSLPLPCASPSRIGITVSMAQVPMLGSAAAVLDTDRADLDLDAVVLEEDAVVVDRLGVEDFAEI